MNNLKRILTIALCSVLLVCAVPQFSLRSEAAEAVLSTEFLRSAIGYLSGYLVSKGYSVGKSLNFNYDLLDETLDRSILYQFYTSYFDTLKASSAAYATQLQSALERAFNSGVFSIDEDLDNFLTNYFESFTVDSSLILGSSTVTFEPYSSSTPVNYSFNYIDSSISSSPLYTVTTTVNVPYDYLPILIWQTSGNTINGLLVVYLPKTPISSFDYIYNLYNSGYVINSNTGSGLNSSNSFGSSRVNNTTYYWLASSVSFPNNFPLQGSATPDYLTGYAGIDIDSIYAYFLLHGVYDSNDFFNATQIEDTSEKDILSSASEVDSDTGVVSGGFTLYMRDWSLFQQILRQFSDGILSWQQTIKALGLSQVQADATPAEKEAALDKVAYPDSTYDWLTSTAWGDGLVQSVEDQISVAHEDELSIADEASSVLNGGNEPSEEDKQKAGNAALLGSLLMWLGLWSPPGYDPNNPGDPGIPGDEPTDPNNPDYFGETIAGMSVAGSLLDDLWDSVGGSSGLGIVFTIGASFIVFSVVIGAANYIGSLGNDIESRSQSKYASQDRAKSARQGFKVKGRKGA